MKPDCVCGHAEVMHGTTIRACFRPGCGCNKYTAKLQPLTPQSQQPAAQATPRPFIPPLPTAMCTCGHEYVDHSPYSRGCYNCGGCTKFVLASSGGQAIPPNAIQPATPTAQPQDPNDLCTCSHPRHRHNQNNVCTWVAGGAMCKCNNFVFAKSAATASVQPVPNCGCSHPITQHWHNGLGQCTNCACKAYTGFKPRCTCGHSWLGHNANTPLNCTMACSCKQYVPNVGPVLGGVPGSTAPIKQKNEIKCARCTCEFGAHSDGEKGPCSCNNCASFINPDVICGRSTCKHKAGNHYWSSSTNRVYCVACTKCDNFVWLEAGGKRPDRYPHECQACHGNCYRSSQFIDCQTPGCDGVTKR